MSEVFCFIYCTNGNYGENLSQAEILKTDVEEVYSENSSKKPNSEIPKINDGVESVNEGYLTAAKNYVEAFISFKSRFGRENLLNEFSTRELFAVLRNASDVSEYKISISSIFDIIWDPICAPESLGDTTHDCNTTLCFKIDSSFADEIPRILMLFVENL